MVLDASVSVEACVSVEEAQDEVLWVAEEQHVEQLEEEVRNTTTSESSPALVLVCSCISQHLSV